MYMGLLLVVFFKYVPAALYKLNGICDDCLTDSSF